VQSASAMHRPCTQTMHRPRATPLPKRVLVDLSTHKQAARTHKLHAQTSCTHTQAARTNKLHAHTSCTHTQAARTSKLHAHTSCCACETHIDPTLARKAKAAPTKRAYKKYQLLNVVQQPHNESHQREHTHAPRAAGATPLPCCATGVRWAAPCVQRDARSQANRNTALWGVLLHGHGGFRFCSATTDTPLGGGFSSTDTPLYGGLSLVCSNTINAPSGGGFSSTRHSVVRHTWWRSTNSKKTFAASLTHTRARQ
jgi:hypothetical protein